VRDVHFSENDFFAPQQVAWDDSGNFYWGYAVAEALKVKDIKPEDVIELWKLLLYKDHRSSDMVRRVKLQLGERSLDDLLAQHLCAILTYSKQYAKSMENTHGVSAQVSTLCIVSRTRCTSND